MPTFRELLDDPKTTLADLQSHLATLDGEKRIAECRQLGGRQERRLFDLADSGGPIAPEFMVSGVAAGEPVRWYGKNSLPLFRVFEKHFRSYQGKVVGINVQPMWQWFTGPGYFVCRVDDKRPAEVLIDYTLVPAASPNGWPVVKTNTFGSRFIVYGNMYDYLRRVTDEVVIGQATKLGKPFGAFFVACRG